MHKEEPPWLALMQQLVDGYTFRKHYVRVLDLYLWAVASGRALMAAALWRRLKHPLRAALIGQEMCGRIRKLRPQSLATRGGREALAAVNAICLHATQGMLDNVRSAKSARQILLDQVHAACMCSARLLHVQCTCSAYEPVRVQCTCSARAVHVQYMYMCSARGR